MVRVVEWYIAIAFWVGFTNYTLSKTTPPAMELTKLHYNRLPDQARIWDLEKFCVSSNRLRELPHNFGTFFGVVCVRAYLCVFVCVCLPSSGSWGRGELGESDETLDTARHTHTHTHTHNTHRVRRNMRRARALTFATFKEHLVLYRTRI
jgi:hypothetical protein